MKNSALNSNVFRVNGMRKVVSGAEQPELTPLAPRELHPRWIGFEASKLLKIHSACAYRRLCADFKLSELELECKLNDVSKEKMIWS